MPILYVPFYLSPAADNCYSGVRGRGRMSISIILCPNSNERMISTWGVGSWSLTFHAASLPTELSCLFVMQDELKKWLINEPSPDKTCLQDFPPGPNTNQVVRPQNMTIGLKFRN